MKIIVLTKLENEFFNENKYYENHNKDFKVIDMISQL